MGGKVTALGLDVVTESSGHVIAPILPSVCVTPTAPAPLPVPYPVSGSSTEGIVAAPMRTKVNGVPLATVGAALKATHGNEPGSLKDVVSLNTGGAASLAVGAPTVVCELGMMGITGSMVLGNKGPGPTVRSAPVPALAPVPGAAAGTLVMGGGPGGGGGSAGENNAGGADQSANGTNGGNSAPDGQPGQCKDGHPVDVVTGRAYTLPAIDLELPGPLPLVHARVYSTACAERDVGLGFGWACTWSWEIEVRRHAIVVWSDEGIATRFPTLDAGTEHVGPWGWTLHRERERFVLDKGDGIRRVFAAVDEDARRWRLIEIRDRNANTIELTYDEGGRLCEVTDSAGRTIGVESTRDGHIASIQIKNAPAQGRWIAVARFSYDEQGNLAAAIDAEGYATRYQYDDEHRLTRETDRCGLSFCFVYDRAGRCTETWGEYTGRRDPSLAEDVPAVLADGARARGIHHVRLDYHEGPYTEVADSRQVRRYFGNAHGLVDKQVEGGAVVETLYDARGLVLAHMDGEEAVTRYERDDRGREVRVVDPLGRATTYERDARGDVVRIVDPTGGTYELHRDARGNVTHEADPTGAVTSITYDARGLATSIASPTGGVTRREYDQEGNLIEQTGPTCARWRWAYDPLGRCVSEIDPLGHETRFIWTERGDVAAVQHADGAAVRYVYDGERRRTEIQGPGRRTVGLAWGGFHKIATRTDPAGAQVAFRYDREGRLVEVVNELGERHRLRRNGAGLLVREETFDGRLISYKHDKAGRVVREEVAGEITEHAYNAAGELVRRTLADESEESFAYDARGELTVVGWTGGELTVERDAAGRVLREVQSLRGEAHTVASLYDQAGERVRRSTSRGHVEHIERDAAGARTRTILDELHDVHHARDAIGRETMRALPRSGRIQQTYDAAGRLSRRWATSAGSLRPVRFDDPAWSGAGGAAQPDRVSVEHEHRYDAEGERSDSLDRRRGWLQYEYDGAGRLMSLLREATGDREVFTYDAAGNPSLRGVPCTYGPGGRLLQRGGKTYVWDAAGRLHESRDGDDVKRYTWDAGGRLVAVHMPGGGRVEYAYDPLGRRLEARTYEGARLSERTRFVWDGDTIAHAIRARAMVAGDPVVEERTFCFEDGGFVPWAHCETGPDGYGGRSKLWAYYVNDPIGTPEELVDGAGGVLCELDREAWGRTTASEGARAETPLRFQGQYDDGETGLFYNRHRYYDAEAGLYLSPDPIGLAGGLRLFGYTPNPTGWIDPLGLARLPQDARVNPRRPKLLKTDRPVGKSAAQNAQCQADAKAMKDAGYTDIRVDQQQIDGSGTRVGICRPDLGGTSPAKVRVNVEYDTPSSGRGPGHRQRILDNDANAIVQLKVIP